MRATGSCVDCGDADILASLMSSARTGRRECTIVSIFDLPCTVSKRGNETLYVWVKILARLDVGTGLDLHSCTAITVAAAADTVVLSRTDTVESACYL